MMADDVNDEKTGEEDGFEIEVVDDTPEEDRDRKPPADDANDDANDDAGDDTGDSDDDEHRQYSERVQKRIKKLTYDANEERRKRERAERVEQEAVEFARKKNEEIQRLRAEVAQGQTVLYGQAEGRIKAQVSAAQRELRDAYDAGDSEKLVEAQTKLANLVSEQARLQQYKPRADPPRQAPQQATEQTQQPKREAPKPSDRALKWREQNDWFDKDQRMTAVAYAVHNEIIGNGVTPDSDEYYGQIDKEMRKTFPDRFRDTSDVADSPGNVVAAPTRQGGKKPRVIRLTQTQINFCKRLGITPEQYAKELSKQGKS